MVSAKKRRRTDILKVDVKIKLTNSSNRKRRNKMQERSGILKGGKSPLIRLPSTSSTTTWIECLLTFFIFFYITFLHSGGKDARHALLMTDQ